MKNQRARDVKIGSIFRTGSGDILLKICTAVGAPKAIVSEEMVRGVDISNGEIIEVPPSEIVIVDEYAIYAVT